MAFRCRLCMRTHDWTSRSSAEAFCAAKGIDTRSNVSLTSEEDSYASLSSSALLGAWLMIIAQSNQFFCFSFFFHFLCNCFFFLNQIAHRCPLKPAIRVTIMHVCTSATSPLAEAFCAATGIDTRSDASWIIVEDSCASLSSSALFGAQLLFMAKSNDLPELRIADQWNQSCAARSCARTITHREAVQRPLPPLRVLKRALTCRRPLTRILALR